MPTVPPPQAAAPGADSSPPPGAPDGPSGSGPRAADEPAWPLWTALAAIALGFGLGIVASIFLDVVARTQGSSLSHPTPAVSLIGDLLFDLAFVAAAVYMVRLAGGLRAADFGFRRVPVPVAVATVVVAAIGYYVITAVYAAVFNLHGNEKLPSELGVGRSTAALVGAAIFVCVVAPVAEEFFFRGFIFGVLRRWRVVLGGRDIGTWLAAAVTGILFGLAHTGSANARYLVPLGFLGFVLCLVRWRTGSLYPCMALHSLNNCLALGIAQLHWNAGEVIGLIGGSVGVILLLTGPLSRAPRAHRAAVI